MKIFLKDILPLLCFTQIVLGQQTNKKVVCYYDTESNERKGIAKLSAYELKDGIELCTHLVYGYASFTPETYEISKPNADYEGHSRRIIGLKSKNPQLKIYLSLGGGTYQDGTRMFDGLDLAFQFPRNKPRKVHSAFGKAFKILKKIINPGDFIVDKDANIHKQQFTEFVNDLHQAYAKENLSVSLTVLPNVNSSWYFDISKIHDKFEYINLFAFDFLTPERNPDEADYTAPIYFNDEQNRLPHYNIDFQVQHWIDNGCPAYKLNLGISTYGRAWKTTADSDPSGVPVVAATVGPAAAGIHSKIEGLLSWTEICAKVTSNFTLVPKCIGPNAPAHTHVDIDGRYGNYAFCSADENNNEGIWISYDDPHIAGIKAKYAKEKGLGGVALFDMSYDDFRGVCTDVKYPILKSVNNHLLANSTTQ